MHKKRVRDSFYYYTTIRKGGKTNSVYLGRNFFEARRKELKLNKSGLDIPQLKIIFLLIILFFSFAFVGKYTGFLVLNETNLTGNESLFIEPVINETIIENASQEILPETHTEENVTSPNLTLQPEKSLVLSGYDLMDANNIPVVSGVYLNSTTNGTFGIGNVGSNLTVNFTVSDADGNNTKNITNWYLNNQSIMLLNMPFEGGSNATYTKDYSGFNNNGVVTKAIYNPIGGHDGFGAYVFNGTTDYISVKNININKTSVTVSVWVYRNGTFPDTNAVWGGNAGANQNMLFFQSSIWGNKTMFRFNNATTFKTAYGNINIIPNIWNHITISWYPNGDVVSYVNGVLDYSTAGVIAVPSNMTSFNIGSRGTTLHFNGSIDDVQIYNRSLSAEEIKLLFNNGTDMLSSNELAVGDVWQANVTVNDGVNDSAPVESNYVQINSHTTTLNDCGNLNLAGELYQLANDVNASGTCFNITANNLVLDCLGYKINYTYASATTVGSGVNNTGGYDNITIQNCNFSYSLGANLNSNAIYFINSENNTIINNTIFSNGEGIFWNSVNNSYIINNTIFTAYRDIYLRVGSSNDTLIGNTLKGGATTSSVGVYIESVKNMVLRKNIINKTGASFSIFITGTENLVAHYNHSIDDSNLADGKPINYTFNISNAVFTGINFADYGQVIFTVSHNITISYCNFTNHSLYIASGTNFTIDNNNFTSANTYSSLYAYLLSQSSITNNWFDSRGSVYYPLTLTYGNLLTISNNTFVRTIVVGLNLARSTNTKVRNNNFNYSGIYYPIYDYVGTNNEFSNNSIFTNSNRAYGSAISYGQGERYYNNSYYMNGNNSVGYYINLGYNNLTIQGDNIQMKGYNSTGVFIASNYNITIKDTIINVSQYTNSYGTDINITSAGASIILLNLTNITTYGPSLNITIIGGSKANATINVMHYLETSVFNPSTSLFLNLANVSAYNITGTLTTNGTSDANGNLTLTLQEFMMNATGRYYQTNYTVNASYGTNGNAGESINITGYMRLLLNITANTAPYFYNITFWDNVTNSTIGMQRQFNGSFTIGDLDSNELFNISTFWYEGNAIIISNNTAGSNMSNYTSAQINGTMSYISWNLTSGNYRFGYNYSLGVYVCDSGGLCNQSNSTALYINASIVNDCGILNTTKEIYQLANNVNATGVSQSCFNITANNIILDCLGYQINHTDTGYGVVIQGANNSIVQNCNITKGSSPNTDNYGIYLSKAHYNNLTNNTININGRGIGIYLTGSQNNTITNITMPNLQTTIYVLGIFLTSNSDNNTFEQIKIRHMTAVVSVYDLASSSQAGVFLLTNVKDNKFRNNNITMPNRGSIGVFAIGATVPRDSNHTIGTDNLVNELPVNYTHNLNNYNLTLTNMTGYGEVIIAGSSNINVSFNNFTRSGLWLYNVSNSYIQFNNFTTTNSTGLFLHHSHNNTIENNSFYSTAYGAIFLLTSNNNTIKDSYITVNSLISGYNVYIVTSHQTTLKNLNITKLTYRYSPLQIYNSRNVNIINVSTRSTGTTVSTSGLEIETSNNLNIYNSSFICTRAGGVGCWALYISTTQNNISIFNTILNSSGSDIYIRGIGKGAMLNLTNVTYNNVSVTYENTATNLTINVMHYLETSVFNPSTSLFLNLANVSAYNNTGTLTTNGTTDANGNLTLIVQEFMMNATGRYYQTNYTVNASYGTNGNAGESINITGYMRLLLNISTNTGPFLYNLTLYPNITSISFGSGIPVNGSSAIGDQDINNLMNITWNWWDVDTNSIIITTYTNNSANGTMQFSPVNLTGYQFGHNYTLQIVFTDGSVTNQSNWSSVYLFINNTIPFFRNITLYDNITATSIGKGRQFNASTFIEDIDNDKLNISFNWININPYSVIKTSTNNNGQNVTNGNNGTEYYSSINLTNLDYNLGFNYSMLIQVCDNLFCNTSNWSTSVLLINNSIPTNVSLNLPLNDSSTTDKAINFSWGNATDLDEDIITYNLEVDNDSDFSSINYYASQIQEGPVTSNISAVLTDGAYYWRVIATDNFTNSTYSDARKLTITTPGPGGGGGGGGGAGAVEKIVFNIFPQLIQSFLPKEKDQIKTFSITNNGTSLLTLKLNVINLENIINLSEYYVKIKPGEEKIIEMRILADKELPGIYTGEIQAVSKSLVKVIPIVIEIESESPLFDVLAEIPEDYINIEQGNPLVSKITLENKAVTGKNVNANVTYYIKDFEGNNLYEERETVSVEDVITYNKRFDVNLEAGDYLLAIKVDYENTTAVSSSTFKVIPKTVQEIKRNELLVYAGIILALVIILIISIINYKRIKKFGSKKLRFKIKDDSYKEKKDIIDKAYKEGLIKKPKGI